MRRAHWLQANRGAELPTLLLAIDTETRSVEVAPDTVEAVLRFGWLAWTRRHRGDSWTPWQWRRFTTPDELWDVVEGLIPNGWRAVLVAHNAGFDLRVTAAFARLPSRGWELRGAVIEDPPTILRWRHGKRGLLVLDSLNYFRVSLASIGAELGLTKLGMPPDADLIEHWDAYCRRDVAIVLRAMLNLMARVREWDLGHLAPTLAGQAFTAWRHRHLSAPVWIDANESALELARSAYYGGRTEAFRLGPLPGPVTVYDVVAMYPACMRTEAMPTVLRGVYRRVGVVEAATIAASSGVIAQVTMRTQTPDYPYLHRGRLLFPIGSFRTVLPRPELLQALRAGHVRAVHRLAVYDQAPIFTSYVDEWWGRRADALAAGNAPDAYYAKLMLNALYGKLGQRGRVYETVGQVDPGIARSWVELDAETHTVHRYRAISGLLAELTDRPESRDSHPAIAATVTSAARVRLLSLLEATGRPWVAYVDTDSLFVLPGAPGPPGDLLGPIAPGMLKREATYQAVTIHGLKDYTADGRRVTKGVRRDATEVSPGVYRQELFVGLKGAMLAGDANRQLIRTVEKHLSRAYHKGTPLPDGSIRPYRLGPGGDSLPG